MGRQCFGLIIADITCPASQLSVRNGIKEKKITNEKKWLKILKFTPKNFSSTPWRSITDRRDSFYSRISDKVLKSTIQLWSLQKSCKTLEQQQGYYCCYTA
jgi:hypothetical protein